jgi:thiamine kinase-like enzyme
LPGIIPIPFFFCRKRSRKEDASFPETNHNTTTKKKTTTTINNTETKHNSNETHVSLLCELHCTKEFFFSLRRNQKAAKRFFFFASSVPPITICNNEKNPVC